MAGLVTPDTSRSLRRSCGRRGLLIAVPDVLNHFPVSGRATPHHQVFPVVLHIAGGARHREVPIPLFDGEVARWGDLYADRREREPGLESPELGPEGPDRSLAADAGLARREQDTVSCIQGGDG